MSSIPPGIARVPTMLASRLAFGNINRANLGLLAVQEQLSSGKAINRVSDDPVKAAMIGVLDDRLERVTQRKRNVEHAKAALGDLDSALSQINDIALDAKDIASQMVGTGYTSSDRASQAIIVDQMISGLVSQGNRKSVAGYVFGGSTPGTLPVQEFRGGFRFAATGQGLTTDLDLARSVPITLAASGPVGSTSARVRGDVDLDPDLTLSAKLADLGGARSTGVQLGSIEMSITGGTRIQIDLTQVDTVQDVANAVTAAIRQYEADNSVTVLGPGGVSVSGEGFSINVAAGQNVQFFDLGNGFTARDLGLASDTPFQFAPLTPNGIALNPKLTLGTPISALAGTGGPLGSIRVRNAGGAAVIDLSTVTTIEELKNAIENTGLGIRVSINSDGTGLDISSEFNGSRTQGLAIEEVAGNNSTATRLGIRSFAGTTAISDLNEGRGVRIIDGVIDPTSGTATAALNSDFRIVVGDAAQTKITIDLTPADMTSVSTMLAAINTQVSTQLASAGLAVTDLTVGLSTDGNGLVFTQNAAFPNPVSFEQLNNSMALNDLGINAGSYDASTSSYRATDVGTVRPSNLLTALIDLRDALRNNDTSGIALAGGTIEKAVGDLTEVRGLVGGYAQRVDFAGELQEDQRLMDTSIRSNLQDTDFTEAAMRLSLLQTQLQAGYQSTSASLGRSLLDFLR